MVLNPLEPGSIALNVCLHSFLSAALNEFRIK